MQTLCVADAEKQVSRSFLFVPGDSERKLEKSLSTGADALIVDLEDAVAEGARADARQRAAAFIAGAHDVETWVRINPLDTDDAAADLAAVLPAAPAGIVLPKPHGAADVIRLAARLDDLEKVSGLPSRQTAILPICTEHPIAIFGLHQYAEGVPRLAGLTWGAEDLAAAVGATENRDAGGEWLPPYQLARTLCLFAASAAGVAAIDTVYTDFKNLDGLTDYAANARRDGFRGMLAIHPDQVAAINHAFVPSADEVERAERIVQLFADNPGAGTLGLDGEMIDRPHVLQAERILRVAEKSRND